MAFRTKSASPLLAPNLSALKFAHEGAKVIVSDIVVEGGYETVLCWQFGTSVQKNRRRVPTTCVVNLRRDFSGIGENVLFVMAGEGNERLPPQRRVTPSFAFRACA